MAQVKNRQKSRKLKRSSPRGDGGMGGWRTKEAVAVQSMRSALTLQTTLLGSEFFGCNGKSLKAFTGGRYIIQSAR